LKSWISARSADAGAAHVGRGCVFVKSKKLHQIEGMFVGASLPRHVVSDSQIWANEAQTAFGAKWGEKHAQSRANLLDYLYSAEGANVNLTAGELSSACAAIRHRRRLDYYGLSVAFVRLFIEAAPMEAVAFFQILVTSTKIMSAIELHGRCYGKESSLVDASSIRAIIPLPAVLQIADAVFASRVHSIVGSSLPLAPGCWVGPRPYTQILDIAHGFASCHREGSGLA
jgi:hypothetical protein